jgi:hypothetical protein
MDGRIGRRSVGWDIFGLRTNELVLDLGSEEAVACGRAVWFLVNHFAGLESSCENPEGDAERGNAVVDVAPGEGSYGLKEWACEGLRRERMMEKVREWGVASYALSKKDLS